MNNQLSIFAVATSAIALLGFKPFSTPSWSPDPTHSRLGFTVTHLGIADFTGAFNKYEIKMKSNVADFSDALVEMSGDASSIDTENEARDTHIKSADFLDAEKF